MEIAVLGMGRMGRALAQRLLDGGHDVVVWNRTPGSGAEVTERGAGLAPTVADAVSAAEVVITSLANDDAVRHVALGPGGVRSAVGQRTTYVDASTVSPALSAELDGAFELFAAMPILGSPAAVSSGQAVYLLGGSDEAAEAVQEMLPSLSETVRRYGAPALAATAKLAVNLLLLDGVVALAESFAVGRAGGLSEGQLRELLADSPMVAPGLRNRFEGVLNGEQDPWWTTVLGAKDAALAVKVVEEVGGDLAVTRAARDLYDKVASSGSSEDDIAAVGHLYRH